jgi:glutamyl-tRNA reductase
MNERGHSYECPHVFETNSRIFLVTIILIGLNHQTAPVEIREQLHLADCTLRAALKDLSEVGLQEVVILSTCNRIEIYAVVRDATMGWQLAEDALCQLQGFEVEQLRPHLYRREGRLAVEHLMRVASGLESMILGEAQILGQVAEAFTEAQKAGTSGALLSHLFAQAIHAGKRARTETDISRHTTSISHAAVQLIHEQQSDPAQTHILLVGAGEMARLAGQALAGRGFQNLQVINRTFASAEILAGEVGAEASSWNHLPEALIWADVVITATGAPHTVIRAGEVTRMMSERDHRPLLFVDLAVPLDVEIAVGQIEGVTRYDIDDLRAVVDANLAQRIAAASEVELIIDEEAADFMKWLSSRQVAPVIADLRRKAEAVVEAELQQALRRLDGLQERDQQIIAQMAHRIMNKMLHEPTMYLKSRAADGDGHDFAHLARELFALDRVQPVNEAVHE